MWRSIFPRMKRSRSLAWYYPSVMDDIKEIIDFVKREYTASDINAYTILYDMSEIEMETWKLTTRSKVKQFCEYLKKHINTNKIKVRVIQKEMP